MQTERERDHKTQRGANEGPRNPKQEETGRSTQRMTDRVDRHLKAAERGVVKSIEEPRQIERPTGATIG